MKDPLTPQEEGTKLKKNSQQNARFENELFDIITHISLQYLWYLQIDRQRLKDKGRELTTHT